MLAVEYVQSRLPKFMVAAFLLVAPACDKSGNGAPGGDPTGEARIAIVNAPNDVRCIRVNAAGTRVVTNSFGVMAGEKTAFTVRGLPVGLVTFTADAFGSVCPAVNPGTVPTWVSDSVTTGIAGGSTTNVTLTMQRPGTSTVSIDFPGDAGATSPPPATQTVGAGQTATSQNFKMVYTFGQPTTNQDKSTSANRRLRGGLQGANGSGP
jgi:hypothetical protein